MKFYCEEIASVLRETGSTAEGLSSPEAASRLQMNGKNKLAQAKKDSLVKRFFAQLSDPMIIILLIAAAVSALISFFESDGHGYTDTFIILAVVIINTTLGVYQESKAEKAIEALQEMAAGTSKVIRDGRPITVKTEDVVVGDIVVLEAGDAVPADGRIIESMSLQIEEAALTGESVPVNKTTEVLASGNGGEISLGDRKNMVYMGSTVVYGRGKAVIVGAGMKTEMGKIADALANAVEGNPASDKARTAQPHTYLPCAWHKCACFRAWNCPRAYFRKP